MQNCYIVSCAAVFFLSHNTLSDETKMATKETTRLPKLTIFSPAVPSINLDPCPGEPLHVTFTPKLTYYKKININRKKLQSFQSTF